MERVKNRAGLKEFGTSLQNKGWHGSKGLQSIFFFTIPFIPRAMGHQMKPELVLNPADNRSL